MSAATSFRDLVMGISTADRTVFTTDLGKVQPVVLVDPSHDQINVTYVRLGGEDARAFGNRRSDQVVLQWTVSARVWQDASQMDEAIKAALLKNGYALFTLEGAFSGPSDDAQEPAGEDPLLYTVQQSALLMDADW